MRLTVHVHALPRDLGPAAGLGVDLDLDLDLDLLVGLDAADRSTRSAATILDVVRVAWPSAGAGRHDGTGLLAALASLDRLAVDGHVLPTATPLSRLGLHPGSRVDLGSGRSSRQIPTAPIDGPAPASVVRVVGGLDAGARFALPPGTHALGRTGTSTIRLPHPTVSRRHGQVQIHPDGSVTLADHRSRNGVRLGATFIGDRAGPVGVDEVFTVGAVQLAVSSPTGVPTRPPARADGCAGTIPFNRPPRMAPPPPAPPIAPPAAPRHLGGRTPFSWAMFLVPLVIGLVMARLFNPLFAIFSLLSPVMMVASWLEQTRRARRAARDGATAFGGALDAFAAAMTVARHDEQQRRLRAAPDLSTLVEHARHGNPALWERRPQHGDFSRVRLGTASLPWAPIPDRPATAPLAAPVRAVVDAHALLDDAPVAVDLRQGHVIGLAGSPAACRAVARSLLVQLAVQTGPTDLAIDVIAAPRHRRHWAHLAWAPHVGRLFLTTEAAAGRTIVTLVDDPDGARHAELGPLLVDRGADAPRSAIVIATTPEQLPACCTTVVIADDLGHARVAIPATGEVHDDVLLMGASEPTATVITRALARFSDPEQTNNAAKLPRTVSLEATLGHHVRDAAAITQRWRRSSMDSLPAVIGVGTNGPVAIDLVRDGPHGLIGGTTGSGKSELLRGIIADLAAGAPPDHLNFVLIDYKGGSAFDACARLPHTVGLVTDLDEHLAERALLSLDAELRTREGRLRAAGANDLAAYRDAAGPDDPPLPRLVVIIDEFAALAAELPAFLDALVAIAQRGRSLGVHLLLATQRPHGVISDNIRTNTNLRIALRMLDVADSVDVLGVPDAARLRRAEPGRALLRLGPDELVTVQAPWPSGREPRGPNASDPAAQSFRVRALDAFGQPLRSPATGSDPSGPSSGSCLDALVDTIVEVHGDGGGRSPRTPWLPPLPLHLTRADLDAGPRPRPQAAGGDGVCLAPVPIGLADEPRAQRQAPWSWHPHRGNLLVCGMPGSGTTNVLRAVACGIAEANDTARAHLYAMDFGSDGLAVLAALPHTGAVIRYDERSRQQRLLAFLHTELQRRRGASDPPGSVARDGTPPDRVDRHAALVVLLDDIGAMRAAYDDLAGLAFLDRFCRIALDGPAFGIHVVIAGDRPQAMPPALTAAATQRIVLHLPDAYDYGLCGLRVRPRQALSPGRGFTGDGHELQVARVADDDIRNAADACADPSAPATRPVPIGDLPTVVTVPELGEATIEPACWSLPFGVGDSDLRHRRLDLHRGDHVLVAGPPRSGRTTLLATLATQASVAGARLVVVAVGTGTDLHHALHATDTVTVTPAQLADHPALGDTAEGTLVLIDDAELVADVDGIVAAALVSMGPTVRVVAAGRADRLRGTYGHWTRQVRDGRIGIALRPDLDADGDLWSVRFAPLRGAAWPDGRGVLVRDGAIEIVQVARP
jgi:S-DNA-T family DNA segregation ATPase FtsK/SpoIIIE